MVTQPKLVLVVWEDASTEPGGPWVWSDQAPPIEPMVFAQAGWLMQEDESCIVLSHAVSVDNEGAQANCKVFSQRERIPRGMVRSMTELQPTAKRGRRG